MKKMLFIITLLVLMTALQLAADGSINGTIIERWQGQPLTQENVALAIIDAGIQHPEIVFRQAMLESGWLRSGLATEGNNLFGMRRSLRRPCYAMQQSYRGYARFKHWIYSICDYKLWQGCAAIKGDYYQYLLKRGYAANKNYTKHLKSLQLPAVIRAHIDSYGKKKTAVYLLPWDWGRLSSSDRPYIYQ